jgi:hypothetical protein
MTLRRRPRALACLLLAALTLGAGPPTATGFNAPSPFNCKPGRSSPVAASGPRVDSLRSNAYNQPVCFGEAVA